MTEIIDASVQCGAAAAALKAAGVRTVIRYYSRDTGNPAKRLTRSEALALAAADLRIGVVHEARHGNQVTAFNHALGLADAAYARKYGSQQIGQPAGSTIYFGVDFDASVAEVKANILPYFQGVAEAFSAAGSDNAYQIGVYGSGRTCAAVLKAGLATHAWLAQSVGWADYQAFLTSGKWRLLQGMGIVVAGVDCDPDRARDGQDIGDFDLDATTPMAPPLQVNARSGLRLRSGPGAAFDVIQTLPLGSTLHPLGAADGWTLVDLQGDGVADGYVSSGYLAPIAP